MKIPESELVVIHARSSGPGGQNVNKSNTKVTIQWDVLRSQVFDTHMRSRFFSKYGHRVSADGWITVSAGTYRSQRMNYEHCMEKLLKMVEAVRFAPKKRRSTKPTRASREKRLEKKRQRSEIKRLRKH